MFGMQIGRMGQTRFVTWDQIVATMYQNGQVGGNLPFSDFSKIWQDSAGTTPYTAVEQYVGKIIDKSPNALAFTQATSAARPAVSARVNLLTKSGQFSVFPWTALHLTITPDGASPTPDAYSLLALTSTPNVEHYIEQSFTHPGNAAYVSSFIIKPSTAAEASVAPVTVGSTYTVSVSLYSISSGVVSDIFIGGLVSSQSLVYIGNGAYKTSATYTTNGTVTSHRARFYPASNATSILTPVAGIGTDVTGASVCFASRSNLPYQYVNTSTDYATAGFPHYLKFDGIDDNIVSAAGGSGTAGIYYCGAIQFNKVGAVQTIFSDAGTNSGYKLQLTAANQLQISAGNGTAYTAINTTDTFAVGNVALCEFWDDGTNLGVRLGEGTPVTVARPVVAAGTAQITIGKDNNAASSYAGINMFEPVWRYGAMPNQTQREAIRAICRAKARIA